MVRYDQKSDGYIVEIPIKNVDDLSRYNQALLGILSKITVDPCDQRLREDLKTIFSLLEHINKHLVPKK